MEGVDDAVDGAEVVDVVEFDVEHEAERGVHGEVGVFILAGLEDGGIAAADAVGAVKRRDGGPGENGGVGVCRVEDMAEHTGGGGFAVGTGDADGALIAVHDLPEQFGAGEDGRAGSFCREHFGVIGAHGGGIDDGIEAGLVFGFTLVEDGDAVRFEHGGGIAFFEVVAGDADASVL